MTQLDFSRRVATVLIVGHVLLFLFGFVVATGGHLSAIDVTQLALMGSPLLLAVAVPAFQFVMTEITRENEQNAPTVNKLSARLVFFVVIAFLLSLFFLYGMGLVRTNMSPDQIKIGVGAIETALGAYLGIIRKQLFPDPPQPTNGNTVN